jgi:hypothetical protein
VPGQVYLQSQHFRDGKLADPKTIAGLQNLGQAVVSLYSASSSGNAAGPAPLAAG